MSICGWRATSFTATVWSSNGVSSPVQRVLAPITAKEKIMSLVRNFHRVRIGGWVLAATLGVAAAPLAALAQASPNATTMQSSSEQGVTVKVTPKSIGAPDSRWEFNIVLDTHSADLNDDLLQSATLMTSDGRTLKPVSWTGAAPGGHHREGVLAFEVPAPRPATIELRIERPGESTPRTFRWQL
jgi:hypothetical protein